MWGPTKRRGFSLVELLVVIGIIGVLIGILLPVMARARESARALDCENHLRQLAAGCVLYLQQHHEYPAPLLLPALAGFGPSGITRQWLDELGSVLRWQPSVIGNDTPVSKLPTIAVCPYRRQYELFDAADVASYGVAIWTTGYSYTARLDERENLTGVVLKRAHAIRRGGHRGVLLCDTLAFMRIGGQDQGYSAFHVKGKTELSPDTGTVLNSTAIVAQHRAYDDGSVQRVAASEADLSTVHLDQACPYKLQLPGGGFTIWFWF